MKSKSNKVWLSIRLDPQVEFGESVAVLGSSKELGSWKKKVPLNWTENGWVCKLEFKGEELIEYKFVTVRADKSMLWEGGDNRVLKLLGGGSFGMVCHWNAIGENVDLFLLDKEGGVEYKGSSVAQTANAAASSSEVETSPFVGQWKGNAISFMRSNEHWDRESGRNWDTSGLQGLSLKLVEGDRNARIWWRKLEVVRDILLESSQSEERLDALINSSIYLKARFLALKMEVIIDQIGTLRFPGLY